MIYRKLGNTGLTVSAISMGCAAIGNDYPPGQKGLWGIEAERLLNSAYGNGITLFDTSPDYGASEDLISRWSRLRLVTVLTKRRSGEVAKDRLLAQVKADKIDHVGNICGGVYGYRPKSLTLYDPDITKEAIRSSHCIMVQFPFNMLDQRHAFAFGRIGTIARSPLLRGRLAHDAERALRFSFFSGADTTLVGFRSAGEIEFAVECLEKGPLPEADLCEIAGMATTDPDVIDPRRWDALPRADSAPEKK